MAKILRDAGLSQLIKPDETLETLASGFTFTEGPLWLPEKGGSEPGSLLFQDMKGSRTHKVGLGPNPTATLVRGETRGANGQTFGPGGFVYFCEQDGRRISRMKLDAHAGTPEVETVAENWSGKRLNSPNDMVCRSDGLLVFTDPPYGVEPSHRALHFQGVYSLRVDPNGGEGRVDLLADDFEKPNGLAFSPDETTLYVCDTGRYHVRAFDLTAAGTIVAGSGRTVAKLDPTEPGGPDGLKVDRLGRLYVAVAQGIWVFEPGMPQFHLIGILETPKRPSNLAWCGPSAETLALTMIDSVLRIRLRTSGVLPPYFP